MNHTSDIPESILSTIEATFVRHFMDMQLIRCTTNTATSTITLSLSFEDRHCDLTLYCSLEAHYTVIDDSDIELSINSVTLDTTLDSHNADIFYPAHRFWYPHSHDTSGDNHTAYDDSIDIFDDNTVDISSTYDNADDSANISLDIFAKYDDNTDMFDDNPIILKTYDDSNDSADILAKIPTYDDDDDTVNISAPYNNTTYNNNPAYILSPRQFTRGLIMAYTAEAEFHPQL